MKKQYDDDDGRVIVSMDVDGIRPWRTHRRVKADKLLPKTDVTKKEAWHVALNATLAALCIAGVMMLGVGLVVWILTLVW